MKFLSTAFSALVLLSFTGCYTVIWTPDKQFPTADSYYDETAFYADSYYGSYYHFYGNPWWFNITPPAISNNNTQTREGNSSLTNIRNSDGTRNTGTGREIITNQPAGRTGSSDNNSGNRSSDNSGETRTNTNEGSTSTSTSTGSDDNRSIRNNDGNRNSGGGRR